MLALLDNSMVESREPGTWHLAPPWGAWKGVVNESGIPNIA